MSLNVTSNIGVIGYNISNEIIGKFVAITSGSNTFAYSSDGINWTEGTLPNNRQWDSVCYGNDKFVTIAYSTNYFAYSTNGITWTESTISSTEREWNSVCYGNDKFVVVAYNDNTFAYSTDGINWTEGTISSTSRYWKSVCYGNGKYVAVALNSNYFAYSTDGINWTEGTISSTEREWNSVCYGNDKFVTVNFDIFDGSDIFAYSTDGINWTEGTLPMYASWESICYGNGKFITADINSNTFAYSSDGINWTEGNAPISLKYICYGNGKFISLNQNSKYFAYSTDGITWTEGTISSTEREWNSVCYGSINNSVYTPDKAFNLSQPENASTTEFTDKVILDSIVHHDSPMYLLINQKATNNNFYIHSPVLGDITLTGSDRKIYPVDSNMNRNCIGGKLHPLGNGYVAYSVYSNNMDATTKFTDSDTGNLELITGVIKANPYLGYYKSVNGINFYGIENDEDGFMQPYQDLNPTFVIGGLFVVSDNGNTIKTGNKYYLVYEMCYGNGIYVGVVGNANYSVYSTDGMNWTKSTISSTSKDWYHLCYGNGMFIASTNNSPDYAYSIDGMNWTESAINTSILSKFGWVSFANDRFFAVMSGRGHLYTGYNTFAYSFDGINWTKGSFGAGAAWSHIAYGNNKYVAIANMMHSSYKKNLAYSTDGITWTTGTISDTDRQWWRIYYINGLFITLAGFELYYAYSTDGITWTESMISDNINIVDISYGDNMYIMLTWDNTNYKTMLYYSNDLINWVEKDPNCTYQAQCICYSSPVIEFSNNHTGISTDVTDVNGISSMTTYIEQYTEDVYYIHYAWVDRASSSLVRYNVLTRKIDTSSGTPVISNVASYTTTFSIGTIAHPSFHKDKNGIHCAFYHGNTTYTKYYKLTRSGTDDSTWSWGVDSNTYITNENISLMVNKNENNLQSSVAQSSRRMYMVNSSDNLVEFKKTQTF